MSVKAWGLTISVPPSSGGKRCDKNCPYCISKMTGFVRPNPELVHRNFGKVVRRAEIDEVETVLFTGKGDPMLNLDMALEMCEPFQDYTIEIQTNGIRLSMEPELVETLYEAGFNVIAFSIDHMSQLKAYKELFARIANRGMLVRVCLNLTGMISEEIGFVDFWNQLEAVGNVHQLLLRHISVPSNIPETDPTRQWIEKNTSFDRYLSWKEEFDEIIERDNLKPIRTLPFGGVKVYGYEGISVCFSDYCIQETHRDDDLRSLIYLENGHLYTSWSDPASILF